MLIHNISRPTRMMQEMIMIMYMSKIHIVKINNPAHWCQVFFMIDQNHGQDQNNC